MANKLRDPYDQTTGEARRQDELVRYDHVTDIRESFARIRRNRACWRCGAPPEYCECPDSYEPEAF